MPKINVTSASALNARSHEPPAGRLHRATASGSPVNRSKIPRVDQSIATVWNKFNSLAIREIVMARHHKGSTPTAPPQPDPQLQTYQWFTRAKRVPPDIRQNLTACQAHMQPVLRASAITGSRYWQKSLGGSALCLLHGDGRVACRVSASKDDGLVMLEDDVAIQLTRNGPKAYDKAGKRALMEDWSGTVLINGKEVDPFYLAASLAAQLQLPPMPDGSSETCRAAIFRHVEALETSVKEWADNGGRKDLEVLKTWMMDAVPTVV